MRTYTLIFSVIAHVAAIAAVYIAPAFATTELPEPPRTTSYILVNAKLPDPIPPTVKRPELRTPSPDAAPLTPPQGVQPERNVEPEQPRFDDPGAIVSGVPIGDIVTSGALAGPEPPPLRPKEPMHVGGLVEAPKKIAHVAPIYPQIALAAHKEGLVILQAVIDEDGSVREVKVLRSDPLFDQAAMDAVKLWRFTRPTLNGQPIPVVMTVTVAFSLTR